MAKQGFNLEQVKTNLIKAKNELPIVLANQAQNYFVAAFDKQGWDGKSWQEVHRRIPGFPEYEYPKDKDLSRRTRAILIGKGATKLRRAVSTSIRVMTWPRILLVVDLPYARAHNEGLGRMPKRTYMAQTKELTTMQEGVLGQYFDKVWEVT